MSTPAETPRVLAEIAAERTAQDAKWGEQNHADRMPADYPVGDTPNAELAAVHWKNTNANRVAWMNGRDVPRDRNAAWDGILLEEVYEALAETDPTALRAELIQVAAVAAAWIEAIDRRTKCSCTTDCPEDRDENTCPVCRLLDPYDPCPVIGFGCGDGCDCCAPEQQRAADGALVGPVSSSEDTPADTPAPRVWTLAEFVAGDNPDPSTTPPLDVTAVVGAATGKTWWRIPGTQHMWQTKSMACGIASLLIDERGLTEVLSEVPAGGEPA